MGSSCTMRALGSVLNRFTTGLSSKFPNSCYSRTGLLSRNLSSSSSISPLPCSWISTPTRTSPGAIRTIRTVSPLSMGRRSSKIAGRKGAQDAKKSKLYSKIGKELVSALKKGGPNPVSNTALATVLEKAKELDVPKEIMDRNIKKASEKGQEAYIEKVYEVYGYGGASMVVECLTDKINRSVATVREVVKNCGGKMADPGSVVFKFRCARVVNIKVSDADKDQLLNIALDAGAEDVSEPPVYQDDTEEDQSERSLEDVLLFTFYSPRTRAFGGGLIQVDDEAMDLNKELMANLLELDDVDAVYTDQK